MCSIGTCLGFAFNFVQDRLYKRHVGKHGVEARLYGAMAAGPGLAVGCIIFGLTAIPSVHWIAPCVGLVIILSKSSTLTGIGTVADRISVGIHDLSSMFRLSVGMLWFSCLICRRSDVLSSYPTWFIISHVH